MTVRVVDGIKVGFCEHESYFSSFTTPSMHSTHRETGAEVVLLLAPGVKPEDLTDEQIRKTISAMKGDIG
jgi:hypothetical protein